jgi:hypothetical protein
MPPDEALTLPCAPDASDQVPGERQAQRDNAVRVVRSAEKEDCDCALDRYIRVRAQ